MSYCAHCGREINTWRSGDQAMAKFGSITLHAGCAADYKKEHPQINSPERLRERPKPTFDAIFGYSRTCACCYASVSNLDACTVDGRTVHADCVADYRKKLADAAAGKALAELTVSGIDAFVSILTRKR